jgi:hypothetical protein
MERVDAFMTSMCGMRTIGVCREDRTLGCQVGF